MRLTTPTQRRRRDALGEKQKQTAATTKENLWIAYT